VAVGARHRPRPAAQQQARAVDAHERIVAIVIIRGRALNGRRMRLLLRGGARAGRHGAARTEFARGVRRRPASASVGPAKT
jgi:hypothetical protein